MTLNYDKNHNWMKLFYENKSQLNDNSSMNIYQSRVFTTKWQFTYKITSQLNWKKNNDKMTIINLQK